MNAMVSRIGDGSAAWPIIAVVSIDPQMLLKHDAQMASKGNLQDFNLRSVHMPFLIHRRYTPNIGITRAAKKADA